MNKTVLQQRPLSRIIYIMPRMANLWHYYPELSFIELVNDVAFAANLALSDLPAFSREDIEDIAYPAGHFLHETRNLDMGITALIEHHKQDSLPPTPFQAGLIPKLEKTWRKHHQLRLGQLLSIPEILKCIE